jgi:type IV pilus assembly protein PilA
MAKKKKVSKGFKLSKSLLLIASLAIVVIALVVVNSSMQFAQGNNTARRGDVKTILDAIHQYAGENKGKLPANMPKTGESGVQIAQNSGGPGDICSDISPDYIAQVPTDPGLRTSAVSDCTTDYQTGYMIAVDINGKVTVSAPYAQAIRGVTPVISVTK